MLSIYVDIILFLYKGVNCPMKKYFLLLFGIVTFFLFGSTAYAKPDDSDYILSREMYFTSDSFELANAGGLNFNTVLLYKQDSVINEVLKSISNLQNTSSGVADYSALDVTVMGDLEIIISGDGSSYNAWSLSSYEAIKNSENGARVYFSRPNGDRFSVYIPRGKKCVQWDRIPVGADAYTTVCTKYTSVNQDYISYALKAIGAYKKAVQEGILAASIQESFNVYSMYPNTQVPILDILEPEDSNNPNGRQKIKSTYGNVKMSYSLDYHYNMFFGKMSGSTLTSSSFSWSSVLNSISITPADSSGKLRIGVSDEFVKFVLASNDLGYLAKIDTATVASSGFKAIYKPSYSSRSFEPKSLVDTSMRLIVPYRFVKYMDSSTLVLPPVWGYQTVPGYRLSLSNFYVYKEGEDGVLEKIGDFNDFGITKESLAFFYTALDESSVTLDTDINSVAKVGAVVPLKYKEVIINPNDKNMYLTGRDLRFGNDYSTKMTLGIPNKDLLSVSEKLSGDMGIPLRFFAFKEGSDPYARDAHEEISLDLTPIYLHLDFINKEFTVPDPSSSEGAKKVVSIKGFVMARNNFYINEPDLLAWLNSNEAQALTGVEAKLLYEMIIGAFGLKPKALTYDQWVRLQEIRGELETSKYALVTRLLRVITLVIGVLIIFYSIILMLCYLIDITGFLGEFSVLNLMSLKRMYPIWSRDDMTYVPSEFIGKARIVTFPYMLAWMLIGVFIGSLFIFYQPIIRFLVWLYYTISSLVGGI